MTEHEINAWFLRTQGLFVFLDDIQEAIEAEAPPCEGCDEALLAIRLLKPELPGFCRYVN